MARVREFWLEWVDGAALEKAARKAFEKAQARYLSENGVPDVGIFEDESWLDWANMEDHTRTRRFPSVALAKAYGARNPKMDLYESPRINVNEYDSETPWDWETVLSLEWQEGDWTDTETGRPCV